MKNLIFLLVFSTFVGCAAAPERFQQWWGEEEMRVDPKTGEVRNLEEISTDQRVELAQTNAMVAALEQATIKLKSEESPLYLMDSYGRLEGVLWNPDRHSVQHVNIYDKYGSKIDEDLLMPGERKRYSLYGDDDYTFEWILNGKISRAKKDVKKEPFKKRFGEDCHFFSYGQNSSGRTGTYIKVY